MRTRFEASFVLIVVAMVASLFGAVPAAFADSSVTDGVELRLFAGGLAQPVDVTAPPQDPRVFVVEKAGVIRIVEDGQLLAEPFLDIRSLVRTAGGEQGLLGLAFHPKYRNNGKFYVNYTSEVGTGDSTISEFQVAADPNRADAASERVLLRIDQPRTNHNGGQLAFGGGHLFASIGDGGSGGEPAQDTGSLLGKILRLDVDGGQPYAIPNGNPFADGPGRDEIWAYGLRNPWRFSIDPVGRNLYIGDVGQSSREEVDVAPIGEAGVNYGWNTMEGSQCYDPPGCFDASFTAPVLEYSHNDGCSITGGVVYRGSELPQLRGHYFYSDLCGGFIRSFRYEQGQVRDETDWTDTFGRFDRAVAFGTDGFGEIYVASYGGNVYRFSSTAADGCDVNADGYADLVAGAPGRDDSRGAAYVIPGSGSGPVAGDATALNDAPAEAGAGFASALACGDFNADGFGDLAIGTPGSIDSGLPGSVMVRFGGSGQTATLGATLAPAPRPGDGFGAAVAVGDFNRDGYDDLAVGAPGSRLKGVREAGRVHIFEGSPQGLVLLRAFHQNSLGVPGVIETGDRMAAGVAAADFNGDGYDDLAVGIPGQQVGRFDRAGVVQLFTGTDEGLIPGEVWDRSHEAVAGKVKRDARFGEVLATGNFDADPYDDLAIGVPGMSRGAGEVTVLYGSRNGISDRDFRLRQGLRQVAGRARVGDGFGSALAVGDIDGDGWDDLAIGVPGEDVLGVIDAGAVDIVFGERRGLVGGRYQRRSAAQNAVPGTAGVGDHFGAAVRVADFNADGRGELAVGVPSSADAGGSGRVVIVTPPRDEWSLSTPGIEGDPVSGDRFGAAL
jgi:glucose/arabinose dehydrogenase